MRKENTPRLYLSREKQHMFVVRPHRSLSYSMDPRLGNIRPRWSRFRRWCRDFAGSWRYLQWQCERLRRRITFSSLTEFKGVHQRTVVIRFQDGFHRNPSSQRLTIDWDRPVPFTMLNSEVTQRFLSDPHMTHHPITAWLLSGVLVGDIIHQEEMLRRAHLEETGLTVDGHCISCVVSDVSDETLMRWLVVLKGQTETEVVDFGVMSPLRSTGWIRIPNIQSRKLAFRVE